MNGRRITLLALQAALLLLALWALRPPPAPRWQPFSAPNVVDVQFPGGTGVAAEVWSSGGRIGAKRLALLVFRELQEPEALEVRDPAGSVALLLGVPDGRGGLLKLDEQGIEFGVAGTGAPTQRLPAQAARRVQLLWEQGSYRALFDGQVLGTPIEGPAPKGPAHVRLAPGGSVASVECTTRAGDVKRVQGHAPPPGWQRLAWGALAGVIGLCCLNGWVALRFRQRKPGPLVTTAALLSSLALVIGVTWSLRANNLERLTVAPEACEQQPLAVPGPRRVTPGRPFALGERRDGDFTLRATIELQERSAVDLLLRAALPKMDRQILVTLSSDPALASGLARNLGTFLDSRSAAQEFVTLPAGRPLALEVRCADERVEVTLDGRPFGHIADLDLRAGRAAFHALSGGATVSGVELLPAGQPRALDGTLRAWVLGAAGCAALALLFLVLRGGQGVGGLLWCWPVAAAAVPVAPEDLVVPLLACGGVLLLFTPRAGRRVLVWAAGAVLIGLAWWTHTERAPTISPYILNQLAPTDFSGPPLDPAYAWARHPLCRRFNGYLKDQTLRDEQVTREKPPGALRIISLGSSSTYGYGVGARDTWSAQAEEWLSHLWPGREVQVVNAGVPGATAERLRYFLQGVLLDLQPDAVVIDLGFNDHVMGGTQDEREHFAALTSEGIGPLEALLAERRAEQRRRGWQRYAAARAAGREPEAGAEELHSLQPAARFGDSLRDMVAACQAAGVAVVLVQEPTRPGENPPLLAAYHKAMARVGAERGVPVVAPQANLDAAGGNLYIDVVHPNPEGHRIMGLVIGVAVARLLEPGR